MDTWAAAVRVSITGPATRADAPLPALPEGMTLQRSAVHVGRVTVHLAVQALDLAAAVARAVEAVTAALSGCPVVVGAEVLRADEAARLTAHPEPLDLVDSTGAAAMLGVARPRVGQLAATESLGFPRHIAELTRGKVWTRASIAAFDGRWLRTEGRPPKTRT